MTDLEKAADQILIDWLPAEAKAAADALLADGEDAGGILQLFAESVKLGAGADWPNRKGQIAILAMEAYLAARTAAVSARRAAGWTAQDDAEYAAWQRGERLNLDSATNEAYLERERREMAARGLHPA